MTPSSTEIDVQANLPESAVLKPLGHKLVPTGLHIPLLEGYEAQIHPRSRLILKHGITLLSTPGMIDADYRGEIDTILVNLSSKPFTANDGERICQAVVAVRNHVDWEPVGTLDNTEREAKGFGRTGGE